MENLGLAMRPQQLNIGGIMSVKPLKTLLAEEATAAAIARASGQQNEPIVQELAALIRRHWTLAKEAKVPIENAMLQAVASRRGLYTEDKLRQIKSQGGSEIYMMLFATKARQAKALLADVLIGSGSEKPWTINPTPMPDLPEQDLVNIMLGAQEFITQASMGGVEMSQDEVRALITAAKEYVQNAKMETAKREAIGAERALEDLMVEGGYANALDQFLDDLTVFKTAFIKGPVVRNCYGMEWQPQQDGTVKAVSVSKKKLEWDRVDPLNIYPAPWSRNVDDAFLIERHRLSRGTLSAMIGVEGYSEDSIRAVLDAHNTGGLHEWLSVDSQRAHTEGRRGADPTASNDLIDALQYWGSVSGKMLREWGLDKGEIADDAKEYEVEAWMIGTWVIKAMINPDPLMRRPYYANSYSRTPGAFWHESLFDLLRDCQDMCNSSARALANNLGISSGPQVVLNSDRLASGEAITEMFPWKIWQTVSDPMGSSAAPISFFQPQSNANELMGVYEKFSSMADEYSGIPKYMTGTVGDGGASRTASGMSMMIGNASKQIRELVSSIDMHIITPSVERLHTFELMHDPKYDYHGDINIRARGALSLAVRDTAQVRRNEFLQTTANEFDMQIIGIEGRAEVLRASAKGLDMNVDKVVPTVAAIKAKAAEAQQMQQMQQMQQQPPVSGGNGQELANGAPVTDNFQPAAA